MRPKKSQTDAGNEHNLHHARRDAGDAFFSDPKGGAAHAPDDLAELVAESYLASATSGEERGEDILNDFVDEELGGPFVEDDVFEDATLDVVASPPKMRRLRK
jgi:hypothetical protein